MSKPEQNVSQIIDIGITSIIDGRETLESVVNEHPDLAQSLREGLETALLIRAYQGSLDPSDQFIQHSKARLLNRIAQQNNYVTSRRSFFSFFTVSRVVAGALVAAIIFLLSVTAVSYAAEATIPGDTLYPVKRTFERVSTSLVANNSQRGELELEYANRRLVELEKLVNQGKYELLGAAILEYDDSVNTVVVDLEQTNDTQAVSKVALAQKLSQKLEEHLAKLESLKANLPDQAQDGITQAILVSGHGLTEAQLAVQGIHNLTSTPTPTVPFTLTPTITFSETPTPTTLSPDNGPSSKTNETTRPDKQTTKNPQHNATIEPTRTPRPTREDGKTPNPTPDKPGKSDQSAKTPGH